MRTTTRENEATGEEEEGARGLEKGEGNEGRGGENEGHPRSVREQAFARKRKGREERKSRLETSEKWETKRWGMRFEGKERASEV